PVEAHLDVVVDGQARELLDGLDQQGRSPEGVGGVELVAAVPGDVHEGVAGKGDQVAVPAGGLVQEHDRVGAGAGGAVVRDGLPVATVRAGDQVGGPGCVLRSGERLDMLDAAVGP